MQKPLFLFALSLSLLACNNDQQDTTGKTGPGSNGKGRSKAFKLTSGDTSSDTATFELAGIRATFHNGAGHTQTLRISQSGRQLINYIRAIDTVEKEIPQPHLLIRGKDTAITFTIPKGDSVKNVLLQLKNNKVKRGKTIDSIGNTL
ncbi:hypothetical protein [Chitinophaga nivalis]|uniref:Auto-transporter adhesin head GIN domain-containing protein n=1 Tax=Chitinophaga nivalis TaxID=2991709 RepID=A0ABT3IT81_9BACT|nr:hypothetical protein [Chitinophaga nivalis]MCW3463180.1 hypothetical protein [Chitinophaga nivalis]MCW3487130.1 hypothetical protein [Chitinophaga nivalis]